MTTNLPLTVISDLEIVGTSSATNGRSCQLHEVCGEHLCEGDVCRLVLTTVSIQNIEEEAIKVVKVVNGIDTCMATKNYVWMERISIPSDSQHH